MFLTENLLSSSNEVVVHTIENRVSTSDICSEGAEGGGGFSDVSLSFSFSFDFELASDRVAKASISWKTPSRRNAGLYSVGTLLRRSSTS